MKHILSILSISLLILTGCRNQETTYEGEQGLYFVLPDTSNTLEYSFLTTTEDYIDAKITVQTLGLPEAYDRKFFIWPVIDSDIPPVGIDYKQLREPFVMPAGKTETTITVRLYNSSYLENESESIILRLDLDRQFPATIASRSWVRLTWTNQLAKPANWDYIYKMYFGEYSRTKHRYTLAVLGWTAEEFLAAESDAERLTFGGILMNTWFRDNPTLDEKGKEIKPWM